MISININGETRTDDDRDLERWIARNIDGRRRDGVDLCVRVEVKLDMVHVILATAGCTCGGGGGRPPNTKESEILELWKRRKLDEGDFTAGALIGFIHQLR